MIETFVMTKETKDQKTTRKNAAKIRWVRIKLALGKIHDEALGGRQVLDIDDVWANRFAK
jgi:hypothetical protein